MGYYLIDHPNPRYPQTRPRTAWGWSAPTGLVTVHTAEGALDRIAPDTGAENVANFIATRSDAGGYHVLVDTDSTIDMAPDDLMTWHTAAYSLNGPGWGVSAACRSSEWDPDAEWTKQIIARMGAAIAAFWRRQGHDVNASARWLTHDQVKNAGGRIVGLIHHGVIQPGDRSDAWALHPQRWRLDAMLLAAIVGVPTSSPTPAPTPNTPTPEDPPMPNVVYQVQGNAAQYVLDVMERTVRNIHPDEAVTLKLAGWPVVTVPAGGPTHRLIEPDSSDPGDLTYRRL